MIGTGKAENKAIAELVGGASASTNRFDGSTATAVVVPDVGWECIQQCEHDSMGRSRTA